MKTEYSIQEQIESKFILGLGGQYAIDLNDKSSHYNWLFKLGGFGFYSLREATEEELNNARRQLNNINFFKDCVMPISSKDCGEGCRGCLQCRPLNVSDYSCDNAEIKDLEKLEKIRNEN